jgi:hypothetical protein
MAAAVSPSDPSANNDNVHAVESVKMDLDTTNENVHMFLSMVNCSESSLNCVDLIEAPDQLSLSVIPKQKNSPSDVITDVGYAVEVIATQPTGTHNIHDYLLSQDECPLPDEEKQHVDVNSSPGQRNHGMVGSQRSDEVVNSTTSVPALTAKCIRGGGVRGRRTRSPRNAISKADSIAIENIVREHAGNTPSNITADILHITRHAATGLAHLDDAAIRRLLLECKRRLGSQRSNNDARANKQALTAREMDQVLRLLGRIRDDHVECNELPNIEKDWRAIVAENAERLPAGFAARHRAGTTLSQLYSELLRGKNKGHAVRASLTAEQLDVAFAVFDAVRGASTSTRVIARSRAIPADLAARALPLLPADITARLASTTGTSLTGAAILAREWQSRKRTAPATTPPKPEDKAPPLLSTQGILTGPPPQLYPAPAPARQLPTQDSVSCGRAVDERNGLSDHEATALEWGAIGTLPETEEDKFFVELLTPTAARTEIPAVAMQLYPADGTLVAHFPAGAAVKRETEAGRGQDSVLGGYSWEPYAAPGKRVPNQGCDCGGGNRRGNKRRRTTSERGAAMSLFPSLAGPDLGLEACTHAQPKEETTFGAGAGEGWVRLV